MEGRGRVQIYLTQMLSKTPQVEKEQKKRREVKNEAVMRLAGEIRQREQVIFNSNFPSV